MLELEYYNVGIEKSRVSNHLVIKGEISNKTGKNYIAVALRVIVFVKSIPVANVIILVNGLSTGTTKVFEKELEELEFESIGKDITRYEIYLESAY
jgi:hypothetical protein